MFSPYLKYWPPQVKNSKSLPQVWLGQGLCLWEKWDIFGSTTEFKGKLGYLNRTLSENPICNLSPKCFHRILSIGPPRSKTQRACPKFGWGKDFVYGKSGIFLV